MAKKVKKSTKPVAKKAATKKVNAKPTAKKAAPKPAPKKVVAKPATKKVVAKKVVAKKPAVKPVAKKATVKPTAKKVASKPATKKPAAKKVVAKPAPKKAAVKPAAKKLIVKAPVKKVAPKKVAVKAAPKKTVAKPAAKKLVAKAPVKKAVTKPSPKPTAKLVAKKVAVKASPSKPTDAKLNLTLKDDKSAKLALRRKKIQEIKNNYESPSKNDEDNFDNYRLPIIGRTRFNDADLNEFRAIINKKLAEAREELNFYQDQMKESEMNDDDIKFSGMEDGGHTNDKEHLSAMANRQVKFIQNLEGALVRIENKTYGICRMTGNLIDKKRLLAVPHATLSMEAKTGGKKK
jgi:RNA polymerase-binding transcription factor DksA